MIRDYSLHNYMEMPDLNFMVDIFHREIHESGIILKTHWHEHLQFFYVTEGELVIHCNSIPIHATKGDLVVINSNELHLCENYGVSLAFYNVRVDLSFLQSHQVDACQVRYMIPMLQNLIAFKNHIHGDPSIEQCTRHMIEEYFDKKPGYELAVKAHCYLLIVLLLRNYVEKVYSQEEYRRQLEHLRHFHNAFEFMDKNFTEKITIRQLAASVNVSIHHFCRLFKKITGMTAVEYLTQLRLNHAEGLLKEGGMNITEVALASGFDDANYFSRMFKKNKGVSPSKRF